MDLRYELNGRSYTVRLDRTGEVYRIEVEGREHHVRVLGQGEGSLDLEVDQRPTRSCFAWERGRLLVGLAGRTYSFRRGEPGARPPRESRERGLTAEMPGVVRSIRIVEGDSVVRGQTLLILEAMKMELRVVAAAPGTVRRIHCREGEKVERGQTLVELEVA